MDVGLLDASNVQDLPKTFFLYAGMSGLLGWNTILTFTNSYNCDVFMNHVWVGSGWAFWSALAYSISLNIFSGALSSRTIADWFTVGFRCFFGCMLGASGVLALLVIRFEWEGKNPAEDDTFKLGVALLCVFCLACGSAFWQSATFGMAGAIHPSLMQAMMLGQGIAGVVSGAVGFVAGSSPIALACSFIFASALLLGNIAFYFYLSTRNPHLKRFAELPKHAGSSVQQQQQQQQQSRDGSRPSPDSGSPPLSTNIEEGAAHPAASSPSTPDSSDLPTRRSSVRILRKSAWPQAITVCSVLGATFVVFPGVISQWSPAEGWEKDNVNYLVATFQLMDVIGRAAPQVERLQISNGRVVSLLAFLRCVIFIPSFMLMQRYKVRNELLQFAMMTLFAFTNGYVSTLSMILGPSQRTVQDDEKQPVGTLMSFFLCFGIFAGSLLALPTQIGWHPPPSNCDTLPGNNGDSLLSTASGALSQLLLAGASQLWGS